MGNAFGLLDYDWDAPLSDADRDQMLNGAVRVIRKWRLEAPAILFLETGAPLSYIAGQGVVAFSPLVAPLMPQGLADVQRLSKLLEHPQNVQRLIDLLSETGLSETDVEGAQENDAARK